MIPNLIHQVFGLFPGDKLENHPIFEECSAHNKEFSNDASYSYKLWDLETCEELIRSRFPQYKTLWNDFTQPVQRADFIRYCILYTYGGIYVDMDVKIIQNPEPLLKSPCFFTTWHNDARKLPYNAVMGAEGNLTLFEDIIQHCYDSFYEKIQMDIYKTRTGRLVFQTTGHFMLQRVLKRHQIIPLDLLKINSKNGDIITSDDPFFEDWNASTWYAG